MVFCDHRSLVYLDRVRFQNSKIQRWQDELAKFKFTVSYVPGAENTFADMLSRPLGITTTKCVDDNTPAGNFYKVGNNSEVMIYVPSWVTLNQRDKSLMPVDSNHRAMACLNDVLTPTCSKSKVNYQTAVEINEIADQQEEDELLGQVVKALKNNQSLDFLATPKQTQPIGI